MTLVQLMAFIETMKFHLCPLNYFQYVVLECPILTCATKPNFKIV